MNARLMLFVGVLGVLTGSARAATPGLPFTEDFSSTALMDTARTTADWNTTQGVLMLPKAPRLYGAFAPGNVTGTDITADANQPYAVALGDVDGDGDLDLVVSNGNYVPNRLYLNNGTANPWSGVTGIDITADGYATYALVLGDVDGDGDLDLVTGNFDGRNRLYLNNGTSDPWSGVTGKDITLDTQSTTAVALGDVDGDGDLDLVVGNIYDQVNRLYLNNGTSDPWAGVTGTDITADVHHTAGMALGDVDGDGDLDLVVGNNTSPNRVYLNNGTTDPWNGVVGKNISADVRCTQSLVLGDVDGDGDLDLVTANFNQPNRVYLNNGTGDPWEGGAGLDVTNDSFPTISVLLADVDADGDLDLIAGNYNQVNRLYLNNGTTQPWSNTTGINITGDSHATKTMAVGDVDRDGDLDLIAGNTNGVPNRLYLNNGTPNPWTGVSSREITVNADNSLSAVLGDVDGDGDLDLVVGNSPNQPIRLYLNNGTSDPWNGVTAKDIVSGTKNAYAVALGDMDNDGDLDLVVGSSVSSNRLFLNNGTADPFNGVAEKDISSDVLDTFAIALGDVDGDGDLDVVAGNDEHPNRLYLNNGTSDPFAGVTGKDITSDTRRTHSVALGDVDGDGDLDLVVGNAQYQPNRVYLNNGTADPFSGVSGTDITSDAHWTMATALGDVDRDGDLDLVVGNYYGGPTRLYLNNGTSDPWNGATGKDIWVDGTDTQYVTLADVDGDGDLDLIRVISGAPYTTLHLNNGTDDPWAQTIAISISDNTYGGKICVALGDVDADGDLDRVEVNWLAPSRLYLNQAADHGGLHPWNANTMGGSDVTSETYSVCEGASVSGDVDGDGDLDVIVAGTTQPPRLYMNNGTDTPWAGVTGRNISTDVRQTMKAVLGDVDNDGDLDLITGNWDTPSRLYLNNGTADPWNGVAGSDITVDARPVSALALGDLDQDGDLDLVVGYDGPTVGRIYLNNGTSDPWNGATVIDYTAGARYTFQLAVADVDNDGDLDIILGNQRRGDQPSMVYKNDGTGTGWSGYNLTNEQKQVWAMAVGDVDKDGDVDVVLGDQDGGAIRLYLNDGTGMNWAASDIGATGACHYALVLHDMDGDGDLDLLATTDIPAARLFFNNGTLSPFSGSAYTDLGAHGGQNILVGDFARDGRPDIVIPRNNSTTRFYQWVPGCIAGRGSAASLKVNSTETDLTVLVFDTTVDMPPHTSIDFWLSNDGGAKWYMARPGRAFTFPTPGSDLRWRAELRSLSPRYTPRIESISLSQNAPHIAPLVPNLSTPINTPKAYDLTPHEHDAEDSGGNMNWTISPNNIALYSASIDANDVLTVTPKLDQTGQQVATLTLMDSDGLTDTQDITISIGVTGPTPPTAFIFPLSPLDTDDLFCVLIRGTVGDGLPELYEYTWSNGTRQIVHGPMPDTVDTLLAAETLPGETWTCIARTHDGNAYSSPSNVARVGPVRGLGVSGLTLSATPNTTTLGQYVTLSGSLSPAVQGATVFFDDTVTPADGTSTKPATQTTNYFGSFSLNFLPDEAGPWSFVARWLGNSTYFGDDVSAPITVNKAQPTLSLSLNVSSVPLSYGELTATATLDAPVTGSLRSLLSGRTIKLWLKKPDGSAAGPVVGITAGDGRVTFSASSFASASPPIAFNTPGTWRFQAEFEGDNNFKRITSAGYDTPDAVLLTVKDRAGYAIIVVGRLNPSGEGHAQHAKTTDFVYRSFRERGFGTEDIYYLREGSSQPAGDIFVSDTAPSQTGVRSAIETWALAKMTAVPAPLYVVFVDHGSTGKFYVYSSGYGENWYIDPAELSGYFTTLQSGLSAHGGDAGNQNIVFVYGACHSGSFIPVLSGPRRIIVTSSGQGEVSNRGVLDPGGLRDGEFFTTELFRRLRDGKKLKESFEEASGKTREYTAPRSAGAWGDATQNPEVDDNGDGVGTTGVLSPDLAQDGGRSASIELGYGVNAGRSVGWLTVSQTVTLASGAQMPDLLGVVDQAPPSGSSVWIEIKSPLYTGGTLVDPGNPEDSQQTVDLTRVAASSYDVGAGAYTWTNLNTVFTTPGTYQVFYYITDGTTGETSSHMLTTVYRMQAGNRPPAALSLLYPDDLATVPCTTFFAWEPTTDPDGDPVTYRFETALDAGFTTGRVVKDGISATVTQLTVTDGLLDGQTYYWRVLPVDAYGLTPTENVVRTLTVNNQNPALTTALMGVIRDSVTRAGIPGVTVAILPGPYTTSSGDQGNYFVPVPAGTYSMSLSATGYTPQSRSGVSVTANIPQSGDFALVSTNAPFRWGDVSGDAKVGTVDASQILQWSVGLIDRFDCNPGIVKPQFPPLADVNASGGVGTVDASDIIRKRVALITAFSADHNGDGFGPDAKRLDVAKMAAAPRTTPCVVSISTALTAAPGATFDVPIMAINTTGVVGYLLRVEYDAALLEYVEVLPGSLTSSWGTPTINPVSGRVTFAGAGAYELTGSGSLAIVRLRVKDTAQAGQISVLRITQAELNDGEIPIQTSDGKVTVQEEGATIPIAIPNAIPISGDVGLDGKVDAIDIQLVINKALGIDVAGDADTNHDGRVDALDVQQVINAALGIE